MLRRYYHVSNPEQSIRSGGVNAQLLILACQGEINLGTLGLTDPVLLGDFDTLDIIYGISPWISLSAYSVIFNIHWLLTLRMTSEPQRSQTSVHYFLICQPTLLGGTPVDRHLRFVSQSCLEQL